jgi:hypothetical protein
MQRDHILLAYVMFMGMTKTDSQLVTIIPTNPPDHRVEIEAKYNSFYATNVAINATDPQNTTVSPLPKNQVDYFQYSFNNINAPHCFATLQKIQRKKARGD